MAPEQWRGMRQGAAADQYALAVMTYEMLAGRLPFDAADSIVLRQAVLEETVKPIEGLADYAFRVLKRALSKKAEDRFASCVDFVDALDGARLRLSSSGKSYTRRIVAGLVFVLFLAGAFFCNWLMEMIRIEKEERVWKEKRIAEEKKIAEAAAKRADAQRAAETKTEAIDGKKRGQIDSHLSAARNAANGGDWEKAKSEAEVVLMEDPNNAEAMQLKNAAVEGARRERINKHLTSARNASKGGDWEKAKSEAEVVLKENPNNTEAMQLKNAAVVEGARRERINTHLTSARNAAKGGDWEKAKSETEVVLKENPNNTEAMQLKNAAVEGARRERINTHLTSARNAAKGGDWEKAKSEAEVVLKEDPNNADALRLKTEAANNLRTILIFKVTVNGRIVKPIVHVSPPFERMAGEGQLELAYGKTYHLSTQYVDGRETWTGNLDVIANWKGQQERTIVLEKQVALDLLNSFDIPPVNNEMSSTKQMQAVFPERLDLSGVPLKMIKVKAGRFQMGSPKDELGRLDNETQHWVTLTKNYWLGETEVTQGQWKAVMGSNPSSFKKGDNYPVEYVSWDDAMKFCEKLNQKYAAKLSSGYKFSLPTEAQWEYACRAVQILQLSNGELTYTLRRGDSLESVAKMFSVSWRDIFKLNNMSTDTLLKVGQTLKLPDNVQMSMALNNGKNLTSPLEQCTNLDEVGWYNENSGRSTHPVAQKKPNGWGFYDMHGNVWEWCSDWYGDYSGDATDPKGLSSGSGRVYRGGGWNDGVRSCRAASRDCDTPSYCSRSLGFRLALVPVQ